MKPVVIIPARIGATRLPRKPLADIHGKPMIVHVYEAAVKGNVGPVYVATDDSDIAAAIENVGGKAIMTDPALPSGSDRVYAAVSQIDPGRHFDVVINLQGDMPTFAPEFFGACLVPLQDPAVHITSLVCPDEDPEFATNVNCVKAALSPVAGVAGRSRALYFSRSAIPSGAKVLMHHLGIYAFRRNALERFVQLPPSPLELAERLEQLRALEDGMRLDVMEVNAIPFGVDTPEDLEKARRVLAK